MGSMKRQILGATVATDVMRLSAHWLLDFLH